MKVRSPDRAIEYWGRGCLARGNGRVRRRPRLLKITGDIVITGDTIMKVRSPANSPAPLARVKKARWTFDSVAENKGKGAGKNTVYAGIPSADSLQATRSGGALRAFGNKTKGFALIFTRQAVHTRKKTA